jgi:REP element-mobilizing transposase RayT
MRLAIMARRPRLFASDVLYHVIVRGNQRQKTFLSEGDYNAYLQRLARYRKKYDYVVHAYCLMPNHAHLLLESSEHPLAKLMQGLQQSYSQYFNWKHHKTGHVFEGRYKAIICQRDSYLLELIRYIHLNPARAGMVKRPEEYRYCGHHAYVHGKATEIIDPRKVLSILGGKAAYRRFIAEGIGEGHKDEYYEVEDQRFLGEQGFGERMLRKESKEDIRRPKRKSLEQAAGELANLVGAETRVLRSLDRGWTVSKVRTMITYVLVRRLGYRLGEVATYFGRDIATIAALLTRLNDRLQSDAKQAREIERLTKKANS